MAHSERDGASSLILYHSEISLVYMPPHVQYRWFSPPESSFARSSCATNGLCAFGACSTLGSALTRCMCCAVCSCLSVLNRRIEILYTKVECCAFWVCTAASLPAVAVCSQQFSVVESHRRVKIRNHFDFSGRLIKTCYFRTVVCLVSFCPRALSSRLYTSTKEYHQQREKTHAFFFVVSLPTTE